MFNADCVVRCHQNERDQMTVFAQRDKVTTVHYRSLRLSEDAPRVRVLQKPQHQAKEETP